MEEEDLHHLRRYQVMEKEHDGEEEVKVESYLQKQRVSRVLCWVLNYQAYPNHLPLE